MTEASEKLPMEELERIAKHQCRLLIQKSEKLPPHLRELCESLVVLAFSAGAAWAMDIDWNSMVLANLTQSEKQQ